MRIGIFTLHGSANYGGTLQAYALSEVLNSMGHEAEMVIFNNGSNKPSFVRRIIGILTSYTLPELLHLSGRIIRRKQIGFQVPRRQVFDRFYKDHLLCTEVLESKDLGSHCEKYDALIVGSDQVWTDMYSNVLPYFLEGLGNYRGLKIAYAACSAHQKSPVYARSKLKGLLGAFSSVSVRDETTARLLESLELDSPLIVADPTLLYDFAEDDLQILPHGTKYIFCYALGAPPKGGHARMIQKIKKEFGELSVVTVGYADEELVGLADVNIPSPSPFEWVSLLRNSSFVYTDSFHAVLFALRYRRDFVAWITDEVRASRLEDLSRSYKLGHRIIRSDKFLDLRKPIDWQHVETHISSLVARSIDFITRTLG